MTIIGKLCTQIRRQRSLVDDYRVNLQNEVMWMSLLSHASYSNEVIPDQESTMPVHEKIPKQHLANRQRVPPCNFDASSHALGGSFKAKQSDRHHAIATLARSLLAKFRGAEIQNKTHSSWICFAQCAQATSIHFINCFCCL